MSLNTPFFLFFFLPIALLVNLAAGKKTRNAVLLLASMVFLIGSEPLFFPLIVVLVILNYCLGRLLSTRIAKNKKTRGWLVLILVINIGLLTAFKILTTYYPQLSQFMQDSIPFLPFTTGQMAQIGKFLAMPLGLSFFTFQVISYSLDIYNRRIMAEKNLLHFALYLLTYPRLVAGPIMHFKDIDAQLHDRYISLDQVADGARRFIRGLAKKTLIADQLAAIDHGIFAQPSAILPIDTAWLVLISYSLRIYFDFSGYTDIALGIGGMLGFKFTENFNFPYIARSLSDFWRRWHISLSNWFREYVFYPLERRRNLHRAHWQSLNILIVFALIGLWHGVTLNFLIWGIFQGIIISLETAGLNRFLINLWKPFQHFYVFLIVSVSWLIFASPSLSFSAQFLASLIGLHPNANPPPFSVLPPIQPQIWLALGVGILLSTPILFQLEAKFSSLFHSMSNMKKVISDIGLFGILLLTLAMIASATYKAYIYGNF